MERFIKRWIKRNDKAETKWALKPPTSPSSKAKKPPAFVPLVFLTPEIACRFAIERLSEPTVRHVPSALRLELMEHLSELVREGRFGEVWASLVRSLDPTRKEHLYRNLQQGGLMYLLYYK